MSGAVRVIRRLAALTLLLVGVGLAQAPPARAHANLDRSDPPSGAILAASPDLAHVWFTEDVSPRFSSMRLVDGAGRAVPGARFVEGAAPRRLDLALPPLAAGTYALLWRALAEDDGHTTEGVVVFSVGAGAPTAQGSAAETSGPRAAGWVLRGLDMCLLAAMVGGLAVAAFVIAPAATGARRPAAEFDSARRRVSSMALVAAVSATAVGVVRLLAEVHRLPQVGSAAGAIGPLLSSTRWGGLWMAREAALAAGAVLALRIRAGARPRGGRAWLLGTATGALLLGVAAIEALSGHAASLGAERTSGLIAGGAHALAGLLWLGALPALALILWRGEERAGLAAACRASFSILAVGSVLLVLVTGLYSAGREVATVSALLTTTYGRLLIAKTGLFLLVGAIGLSNSIRLHARHGLLGPARRLVPAGSISRRSMATEAVAGAVLLGVVGMLVETPPATTARVRAAPPATTTLYGGVEDLVVSLAVTPNRPGVNGFAVAAASSRRPAPAPIQGVELALAAPDATRAGGTLPLRPVESGRYFGSASLGAAGPWRLSAVVRRNGRRLIVPMILSVAPAPAAPPPHRLAPIVDGLALSALTLASLVLGVVAWRRRGLRRTGSGDPTGHSP